MEYGVNLGADWGYIFAFLWGLLIALFMRKTGAVGIFMSKHMMWAIVATGAGVDLLILRFWFTTPDEFVHWEHIVLIFFLSSICIAAWSVADLAKHFSGAFHGISGE